jgi:membrane peptidoglycan carboxypeptidase
MLNERMLKYIAVVFTTFVLAFAVLYLLELQYVRNLDLLGRGPLTNVRYVAAPAGSAESILREEIFWTSGPDSARRFSATDDELRNSIMLDAIIASEDKRFEHHAGIDFYALLPRLIRGRGASTLTQQTARQVVIRSRNRTILRKVNEAFAAMALESLFTKEQIALLYSNSIYSGAGRDHFALVGVKAAAYYTYGKGLRELSLAESASIAGLFARPKQLLEAFAGDVTTMQRYRNRVLRRMHEEWPDRYSEEVIRRASSEPVIIPPPPPDIGDSRELYGYFLDAARARHSELRHLPEGCDVILTVDPDAQRAASEALTEVVAQWQPVAGPDRHLDGAIVALDPFTGDVVALVGGTDYRTSGLNRALQVYEPGSVVKLPIYTEALANLTYFGEPFTAATRIDLDDGWIGDWSPADHSIGPLVLREAIARSSNKAVVSVGKRLGLSRALNILTRAFKIQPKMEGPVLLGGGKGAEAAPLSVAEAYGALVNGGRRPRARFVREVRSPGEHVVVKQESEDLLDPLASAIVLQASRSVTGDIDTTGATLRSGKRVAGLPDSAQVSGKTGTGTNSNWAVLMHPRLVVVVVVACDSGCALRMDEGFTGGNVAGAVWAAFVARLYKKHSIYFEGSFAIPGSLVQMPIDPQKGCAYPVSGARSEYFIPGRVPRPCAAM